MAYRYNNFKNRQIMKQAGDYNTLDLMLKRVKKLIKRRDKLYKIDSKPTQVVKHAEELQPDFVDDANQIPILD